jgi:predicted metal-dependent hydrolase
VRRRCSRRARRLTLRLDPAAGVVEVVVPESASERSVVRFLRRHEGWIATRLAELPPRVPFADGVTIPVLGEPLRLAHRPEARPGAPAPGCATPRARLSPGAPAPTPRVSAGG